HQRPSDTGSGFGNISGEPSSTLTLNSVTASMSGYQYRVVVSGTCAPAATSTAATLTVNTAPSISVQPSNTTICETTNASFSVTASGTTLTYQWQVNTGSGFSNISGETSSTLTLSSVTTSMTGYQYRVVVSGTCAPAATST